MKIKEGDKLPDVKVLVINMNKEYEHKETSTSEILNKDKIILFGLPGAFTPGCADRSHLISHGMSLRMIWLPHEVTH